MKIMEKSTLCRICLAKDVRMCDVVTNLQETYESLTAMQFETKDSWPSQVCYICYAQLQTCYKLRFKSLHSQEIFRQSTSNSCEFKLTSLHNVAPLLTTQLVTHLSIAPVSPDTIDTDVKDEQDDVPSLNCLYIIDNVQVKEEHVEGIEAAFDADEDTIGDDNDENNIYEAEDILPLSTISNSGLKTAVDTRDDVCPKIVKIVLDKLELTNIGTSVPAPIELTFTEREHKTLSGEEVVNGSSEEYINKTVYFSSQLDTNITDRPYKCDICGKCFKRRMYLVAHARLHTDTKAYGCDICGKDFKTRQYITSHMRTHSSIKPYACDICGRSFKTKMCLKIHAGSHTDIKAYGCDICGIGFSRKYSLTSHILTKHTDIKLYVCDICGKDFKTKYYLSSHLITHTDIKAYACNICGRNYKRKDSLGSHMVTHTDIKLYVCDICGKGFKKKDYLPSHMVTHSGIKPHACDICGKGFRRKVYLNTHMVNKHAAGVGI